VSAAGIGLRIALVALLAAAVALVLAESAGAVHLSFLGN
jgi:hypothetical protein